MVKLLAIGTLVFLFFQQLLAGVQQPGKVPSFFRRGRGLSPPSMETSHFKAYITVNRDRRCLAV
jgi:hypothetical protein